MGRKFSKEQVKFACDNYYTMTSTQIAEKIGSSRSWVLKVWIENNLKGKDTGRKYYSNFDYFSEIDTSNKAYVLGFICADGCIYKRSKKDSKTQGMLRVSLALKDEHILKDILRDMKSDNPVSVYKRNKTQKYSSFSIVSQKIYDDLVKLGVKEDKTWDLDIEKVLSNVPRKYIGDFIRGYFDGDGSISMARENPTPSKTNVMITSPFSVASVFQEILSGLFGINAVFYEDKRRAKYSKELKTGSLIFPNTMQKYLFLKLIYSNTHEDEKSLFLKRKKERAGIFFDMVENNKTNVIENLEAVSAFKQNSWSL